jgi:hypothetical protein
MRKTVAVGFGLLLLFATEILRVYFIMPFPGSQQSNTISLAYFIEKYKWILRLIGLMLLAEPVYRSFTGKKMIPKILYSLVILLYGTIFYFFNFQFQADKMFYQPSVKNISGTAGNTLDSNKLIIGIEINGDARAYPIQLIGYHHQVRDTVGHTPVMITYCTVCRTGRVYSPVVNGKPESFRLVGMDHFNAMFEDASTKSWWRQVTGEAIAGPLKGAALQEIPSRQASLASWLRMYPNSTILQPDTIFKNDYDDLANFDKGNLKSHLEKRDSASWKMKSWVVGVKWNGLEKVYDWNELLKNHIIQDSIGETSILLVLENDTSSFHVFNRGTKNGNLYFKINQDYTILTDSNTHSIWNLYGKCTQGPLRNEQLEPVAAYQEFWHSWKQFHPNTLVYSAGN